MSSEEYELFHQKQELWRRMSFPAEACLEAFCPAAA